MPEIDPEKSTDFSYFIINNNSEEAIPKIFVANPTPDEYKNLGQLFLAAEIKNNHPKNQDILEALVSSLRHTYYAQKEARDIEIAFENALATVNKDLREHLVDLPESWFGDFNILIGSLLNQKLVFTYLGKINSLLTLSHNISNLSEISNDEPSPLKMFTNVSAGDLPSESKIIVCNENILDYFSLEKIRKTLVENDLTTALEYFKRLLDEQNVNANFICLGFQPIKAQALISPLVSEPLEEKIETSIQARLSGEQDSMSELIAKESKTESYLTPSYWPSIKKFASNVISKAGYKNKEKTKNDYTKFKDSANKIRRTNTASQLALTAGSVLGKLRDFIFNLISKFRKKPGQSHTSFKSSFSNLPQKTNSSFNNFLQKITHLSAPRKILLVLAILLIILFTWSITGLGERKESQATQAEIENTLNTVETKINEAKAALLYDNEEGSRELLVDASDLLKTIPNSKDWQEQKDTQQAAIDAQYKAIAHVKTIDSPEELSNFESLSSGQAIGQIFSLDGNIYAFNATNEQIYSLALSDKNLQTVNDSTQGSKTLTVDDLTPNRLAILADNNRLNQFDILTNTASPLNIDLSGINGQITDLNAFSNRLYTLVPQDLQIYRHSTTGAGSYGPGEKWLADGVDRISQAVAMAIDGSVYLLFTDGKVEKYSAGKKNADFSISSLEPSLENATKLYTDETLDNLYILDPNNKRLVAFTKDGKLVQQYFSENFDSLSSFIIDEQNKTAYLMCGTRLYQISLDD